MAKSFIIKLLSGWLLITFALFPIERCRSCKGVYLERMRQAAAPQITAEHRKAILNWAEKDSCTRCWRGRRSVLRVILD